jgi:hypothetical protein
VHLRGGGLFCLLPRLGHPGSRASHQLGSRVSHAEIQIGRDTNNNSAGTILPTRLTAPTITAYAVLLLSLRSEDGRPPPAGAEDRQEPAREAAEG